ncbi:hypothetical protein COHA_004907 [Chlorella ohadii]|uniref:AB hydrolase-1 domain-containing protein n=1 Tax=Chlorella ohadii TaxID=2649997 RepID=A0AAD5DT12_9CHLO|nr:hypothetical protein COHA_004907 [Chlorella ohadii]
MVAPSQPPGEAQGSVTTSMEQLELQAAAFQSLLALESLPQNGRLRLRYLEWGSGGRDVVLLLHDCGEAADIWRPIGPRLADRGYRVIAPDLRGHGESGRSLDCRYGAASLAEDVKALIVALDLYVAPVALVGCGMGAATALVLAQQNPFLAGAVLAAEFSLPVAALQDKAAGGEADSSGAEGGQGNNVTPSPAPSAPGQASVAAIAPQQEAAQLSLSSKQLLPWWGFRPGQATVFSSMEQCAACLAHPLANLSPAVVAPLAHAAAAAALAVADTADDSQQTAAEAAAPVRQLLAQLQRPLRGAVASACSLLRLPARMSGGGGWGMPFPEDEATEVQPRTDPSLLFHFNPAALLAGPPTPRCHLLLLHGGRGSWVAPADAAAMAHIAAQGSTASAAVAELPGAGHYLAADQPDALLRQIVGFLEGPAIRCFNRAALMGASNGAANGSGKGSSSGGADVRRPEVLDLKPLPQYASLEEAQKALGPRAIPTAAAIESELRKLRVEEGRAADDASSDDEEGNRHRTALANNPSDYFGMVG